MSKETLLQPAMHQQVNSPPAAKTTDAVAPAPAVAPPRRRKSRRRRYILIGIGALILLSIVGAVIASKREKPIPVTTERRRSERSCSWFRRPVKFNRKR